MDGHYEGFSVGLRFCTERFAKATGHLYSGTCQVPSTRGRGYSLRGGGVSVAVVHYDPSHQRSPPAGSGYHPGGGPNGV